MSTSASGRMIKAMERADTGGVLILRYSLLERGKLVSKTHGVTLLGEMILTRVRSLKI